MTLTIKSSHDISKSTEVYADAFMFSSLRDELTVYLDSEELYDLAEKLQMAVSLRDEQQ